MPLRLYNTFSKKEEEFRSLKSGEVRMYTCGPTVYGRPHIGNYASFLTADLLRRWLEVSGYNVLHVKNITDVGHLVHDADRGDDKVEAQAKREKKDPLEIAQRYEAEYLEDERALNIREEYVARPRATETIPEMLSIIRDLLSKGHAYETADGIYYSVQSFPRYGKLSGNTLDKLGKLQEGLRVELSDTKKHSADFALWKTCTGENAAHVLRWNFATGKRVSGVTEDKASGFPGWHIECSAMSSKFLGPELDIHTGGEDNIFPHHECEIAQSEAAFGKTFVRYWLHKRRVNFGPSTGSGQALKMSKSLGNILTLPDIVGKGFHPLDLRYFLLATHYRSHTTFTWKGLEDARKARLKIIEWIEEMKGKGGTEGTEGAKKVEEFQVKFMDAMNADLNAPGALAVVFACMAWSRNKSQISDLTSQALLEFLKKIESTFGCFEEEQAAIPEDVQELVRRREEARRAGDFGLSDTLRKEALEKGFVLGDLPEGTKVTPRHQRAELPNFINFLNTLFVKLFRNAHCHGLFTGSVRKLPTTPKMI